MIEQLTEEITKILKDAHAFTLEQAPDIAQQLLALNTVESIGIIALSLLVIKVSRYVFTDLANQDHDRVNPLGYSDSKLAALVIGGIASLIALSNFLDAVDALLQIYIAPELFILTHAANLVK